MPPLQKSLNRTIEEIRREKKREKARKYLERLLNKKRSSNYLDDPCGGLSSLVY